MIYLDNAATSFPTAEVLQHDRHLCPAGVLCRGSYDLATEGRAGLSNQKKLARFFGASDPERVILRLTPQMH